MSRTTLLNPRRVWPAPVWARFSVPTWGELAFAVGAGVALAGLGHFLGRTVHLAWPVPLSGSVAVALPRVVILLTVLRRIDRFGALTTVGIAEVGTKLLFGMGGWWPMAFVVPLLANTAGDVIWWYLRQLPWRKLSLILTGGGLCAARVLPALACWALLRLPSWAEREHLVLTLGCIVIINLVLGMAGGLLVAKLTSPGKGRV